MLADDVMALAQFAGQTVAAAAITDVWESARRKFAQWLGRGDPNKEQRAEARLEETRRQLGGLRGQELEKVQAELGMVWQVRVADLLEDDPDAAAELRALVREIRSELPTATVSAADHSVAAGGDVNITALGGGTAAGVLHGNVTPTNPTSPGPARG